MTLPRPVAGGLPSRGDKRTIKAQVIIEGEIRPLESETETNLFRIAQEALTNTLRHANASEITIELIYLLLNPGFGLIGIEERCDRAIEKFSY